MPQAIRVAVVGDIHLFWDQRDARAIDAAGYDLVLFVGDLAGYSMAGGLRVARAIAPLKTPALVIPGNHDAVTALQLGAEVFRVPNVLRDLLSIGMERRASALARALGPVRLVGYGLHRFPELGLTVLAARPHSIGGPRLAFRRHLGRRHGVRSMADSAARLRGLVDQVPPGDALVVLAHCGPAGLGGSRNDIFGCDFRPEEGDFGDPDLELALRHARAAGKRPCAVVGGHMHHRLRGGGVRRWQIAKDGVTYVNAARVRRHRQSESGTAAHHVSVTLAGDVVTVSEVWLPLEPPAT